MAEAYAHAGVSVTVTSLTNLISFLVCMRTPFLALEVFSQYAALAVVFSYVWQITLFGGCMALFGRLEWNNRHALTGRAVVPKSMALTKGRWYRWFCAGGKNPEDKSNPLDHCDHVLAVVLKNGVGKRLRPWWSKLLVILLFASYFAVGLWACSRFQEGTDLDQMFSPSSIAALHLSNERRFFSNYSLRIQVSILDALDYSDPRVRDKVENFTLALERDPHISNLTESWLRAYTKFVNMIWVLPLKYDLSTKKGYYYCLKNVFFAIPQTKPFAKDIVWSDNITISASRFFIHTINLATDHDEKDMFESIKKIAENAPFKVVLYNPKFLTIEQMIVLPKTTIICVLTTASVMLLVTLLFFPSLKCGTFVVFSIISIETGVLGYSVLWGVKLNTVTLMGLVMSVGFAVDNTAHMTYAYTASKQEDPNRKIEDALFMVGVPIILSGTTTVIVVMALSVAPSALFVTLFKIIFLIIYMSTMHSILLLPTLLASYDLFFAQKKQPKQDLLTK
ncbi:daf-6, partial [Cordylochernes scorpioides]